VLLCVNERVADTAVAGVANLLSGHACRIRLPLLCMTQQRGMRAGMHTDSR
jgi:hypothetical protein